MCLLSHSDLDLRPLVIKISSLLGQNGYFAKFEEFLSRYYVRYHICKNGTDRYKDNLKT